MHEELVEYEIPSNKSVVNGNLSIEYSPNPHVGDNYNYYIYGPVTYVQPKDEEGKEPTSTPYVLEPSDNGNLHSQTHIDNSSKVCIVDSQKFKIRRFHLLLGACMLVLVATTIGLTAYHLTSSGPSAIDNDDDDGKLVFVERQEWNASDATVEELPLIHPTNFVIISHTSGRLCTNLEECSFTLKWIQDFHMTKKGFGDIGYNFLVGGDGRIYVGRGWDAQGRHTKPFNDKSIGISFMGTFMTKLPPKRSLNACKRLLEEGVLLGKLSANYTIYAQKQVIATESPGAKLIDEIKTWKHWDVYDPLVTQPNYTSMTPLNMI